METSLVGLILQTTGIALLAILSFILTRSVRRTALVYWSGAWASLTIALVAQVMLFWFPVYAMYLQPAYLLGEYAFGYLFAAGCRNHATGATLTRRHLWLLVPGMLVAVALSTVSGGDFNILVVPHTAIVAYFFVSAFLALRKAPGHAEGPGRRVMGAALLLLAINFLHYVPIFAYSKVRGVAVSVDYLKYTSLYDLMLQILLGFGTVMLVMEVVRRELESANRDLAARSTQLEQLARMDPLTNSLNRHAFYSLVEDRRDAPGSGLHGCAVVFDVDDLKRINDTLGHAAGDVAIRAVARAIRSLIRADDLVYRWGGDEFLSILFGMSESEARHRLEALNAILARTVMPGSRNPVALSASYGIAPFSGLDQVDRAIERADDEMYVRKQDRKTAKVDAPA